MCPFSLPNVDESNAFPARFRVVKTYENRLGEGRRARAGARLSRPTPCARRAKSGYTFSPFHDPNDECAPTRLVARAAVNRHAVGGGESRRNRRADLRAVRVDNLEVGVKFDDTDVAGLVGGQTGNVI